ncbi:related to Reticulon-like protein 1 [Saccharomycodes ludwigii]|uniref:Reticulon-like protein n=1 Tax=Saccharomycodes ludwigii TaxID=36035 RepID=A0A376B7B4_9ASCO|nr:hypothetical protein SCDLUD_001924 [Saccharomycodes ludwigii]KAH3902111.1 hypothetical protein SCDLUD_001924 [Saccharomycodes ludwigii]SSD60000.1 related to Reticulon-like protein 1 [Saccharomycodes ludwigii]
MSASSSVRRSSTSKSAPKATSASKPVSSASEPCIPNEEDEELTPIETTRHQQNPCCNHCDLLLWKNPVETGKVFGGLLLLLIFIKKINFITGTLTIFYYVTFITSVVEIVTKKFMGQGLITRISPKTCPNIVSLIKPKIDRFLVELPKYQAQFRELIFANKPCLSLKASVVAYVSCKILSLFTLWTFSLLAVFGTFTLPLVYAKNQEVIDEHVARVVKLTKQKTNEYSDLCCKKLETTPLGKYLPKKTDTIKKSSIPIIDDSTAQTTGSSRFSETKSTGSIPTTHSSSLENDSSIEELKSEFAKNKRNVGF